MANRFQCVDDVGDLDSAWVERLHAALGGAPRCCEIVVEFGPQRAFLDLHVAGPVPAVENLLVMMEQPPAFLVGVTSGDESAGDNKRRVGVENELAGGAATDTAWWRPAPLALVGEVSDVVLLSHRHAPSRGEPCARKRR